MKKKSKKLKRDPVCGMNITDLSDIRSLTHKGKILYFCEDGCKESFIKDPEKYKKKPLITLRNVYKTFELGDVKVKVLRGLDMNIWPGDFTAIIGASGSGKSTALNMIGLLDIPTSGKILLDGRDVSKLNEDERAKLRSNTFGFVFQQYNLTPWLTAYENVTLPLIFSQKKIEKENVVKRFQELGLAERMSHRPFELSGGEQQRTAFLRALVNDPEIILGDEPTGNLDSVTGDKILKMLINLNKSGNKTLIIITHDADIAEKADQIFVLKDGVITRNHHVYKKAYTE